MSQPTNIVLLEIGDVSGDGHNQRDTFVLESSKNHKDLEAAFAKGNELFGFSDYCCEYEENKIPVDLLNKLKVFLSEEEIVSAGCFDYDDGKVSVYSQDYPYLWIAVARSGDPDLFVKLVKLPSIDGGGYGCYY